MVGNSLADALDATYNMKKKISMRSNDVLLS